jgi:anti-sigma regulatory factor (Ser/Thr protein kinase)
VLSGGGRGAGTSEISVAIARDPALVRTVRLVAAAVARRSTGDEDLVEEVRLAVGEACALLVGPGPSANGAGAGPVEVTMVLDHRLQVVVRAEGSVPLEDAPSSDIDGIEPWSLLRGLIADLEIDRAAGGTSLSMSWDLPDSSD